MTVSTTGRGLELRVAGAITRLLVQLGQHPGASWSLSWVLLFAGKALLLEAPGSVPAEAAGWVLVGAFPALTLVGALGFAGQPAPAWLIPAGLALGGVRGALVLAGAAPLGHGIGIAYEAPTLLVATSVVWRAGLVRDAPLVRWLQCGALVGVAGLALADGLARALGASLVWILPAWCAAAPVTAGLEVWTMKPWIARREWRLARAEGYGKTLERLLERRKRSEHALREREAVLFERYERAPDMLVSLDPRTGVIQTCNRKFSETLGIARPQLVGRRINELADPRDADAVARGLTEARETGTLRDWRFRLLRSNGTSVEVIANARRIEIMGRPELHAILHNMSRLAGTEPDRPKGAWNRVAGEGGRVSVFMADEAGHCVYVSPDLCEKTAASEPAAGAWSWTGLLHPEERERAERAWRDAVEHARPFHSRHRVDPATGLVGVLVIESHPVVLGTDGKTCHLVTISLPPRLPGPPPAPA